MRKGTKHSEETKKKIGSSSRAALTGRTRTPEERASISRGQLGRVPWNKGKANLSQRGSKHWNWKGGTTSLYEQARKSLEYKLWRKAVFERDNYTCVFCGDNSGGNLEADHIKQFAFYPELRYAIDNGRTLCQDCHKQTDTYGNNGLAR